MNDPETLQDYLEQYLKREGLYRVIPEYRRKSVFTLPVAVIWLAGLWLPAVYFAYKLKGAGGLAAAIVVPPALLAGILLATAISTVIQQLRSGGKSVSVDASKLGGILFYGFPLTMAIALGLYLRRLSVFLLYAAVAALVTVVIALLNAYTYRIHLAFELLRSIVIALVRSLLLLPALFPLLLILTLLSIFSQELWETLGGLSLLRIVGSTLLMVLPALLCVSRSLSQGVTALVGQLPRNEELIKSASSIRFIRSRLDNGLISQEEWSKLRDELEWRNRSKLAERLLPVLQKRVKRWLVLLLTLTSVTLVISLFGYFFIFFIVLLAPSLVAGWLSIEELTVLVMPLSFLGRLWSISFPITVIPVAKVSLLLAVFSAVTFTVYAFTEDPFKRVFMEWLMQKASSWLAASTLYQCITSPGYQIWEFAVRGAKTGIANVSIVVPKGLSQESIEQACEHMESRLEGFRTLVIVTAFEQNPEKPVYRRGVPGNRWQLLHNKVKNIRIFEPIPLILEESRYQDFLGLDSLKEGKEIPDEWFGNTPTAIALSKAIWQADPDHGLILHPYTFESSAAHMLEVHLSKRLSRSKQYRRRIRDLLVVARQTIPDAENIWIDLCFRDTVDTLARLVWGKQLPYVEYKDETIGKTRTEDPNRWN